MVNPRVTFVFSVTRITQVTPVSMTVTTAPRNRVSTEGRVTLMPRATRVSVLAASPDPNVSSTPWMSAACTPDPANMVELVLTDWVCVAMETKLTHVTLCS